jgi:hypothetical protein
MKMHEGEADIDDGLVERLLADLLADKSGRAVPYLYTDGQIAALMHAAGTLRIAHKTATFRTLFGVLAATGMRVGSCSPTHREGLASSHRGSTWPNSTRR